MHGSDNLGNNMSEDLSMELQKQLRSTDNRTVASSDLCSDRPLLKDLYDHVIPSVSDKWRDIGVHLLHPTLVDKRVLEVIAANHPHSVEECCKSMFDKWLETRKDASWSELIKAISTIGLCSVAKELEEYRAGVHSTTLSSNKGSVPSVRLCAIDVSRLKERYLNQPPTCKTDCPKHNVFHYVKLALVEKEGVFLRDVDLNEITKLTLKGEVDKVLKKKQPLNDLRDIFHYENKPCPRLILIIGGPGVGKTTLANEICLQWARDGFLADEFDAVINIPLRSVQERSFETVLKQHVGEEDYPKIKKLAGSRCLLILEGLDEMALNYRQNDETLIRLIKENTLLEKAKILITSRPHACEKFVVDRTVEVVGFGNEEIRQFVKQSFPNDVESIEKFMSQLTEYPQLRSLCYVPLNLVMVIDIFRFSQKKLPSTLTELYRLFIVMTLQREIVKGHSVKKLAVGDHVEVTLCKMLPGISKEAVGIVYLLCKLAYHAFFKSYSDREERHGYGIVERWKDPKIIFTESDLIESGIEVTSEFDGFGLLKATHTHQLPIDIVTYNFFHLTVQEFLCSLYMSTLSEQEQLNLLTKHFSDYPNVTMFLCGLTGLATNEMSEFVHSKLASSKGSYPYDPDVVTAVRSVYESNHSDPLQLTSPFTLVMSHSTILPYDCLCLSWLLSCYPVSQLEMWGCHIEDTGAKLLVRHYPDCNSTGQLLEVLNLGGNDLTIVGLEDVMKIVKTSWSTLRVLNVGNNEISDDGISMISEKFQHKNSLIKLSFGNCGLSVKGINAVSQLLMNNYTLQIFDVGYNIIGDDGLSVIAEQLHHITTLTELNVARCGLSVEGATAISELLKDNCVIQVLILNYNDIGDEGITAITTVLTNSRIRELVVIKCGITLTGATSIATLLSVNNSIRELCLIGNPITEDGAHRILQSAVDNEACQVDMEIDDEYESDEVQAMMKVLEDRRKIKINVVNTTTIILQPAVNNKACQEINDEYKSVEVATDNDEDTERQEGNKNKCGSTAATKRKCCILM